MTFIQLKFPGKLLPFSFSMACALIALPLLSVTADFTWGQLSKYASPIFDEEILLTDSNHTVDITYPEKNCHDCTEYTITAMHVFDMQTPPLNLAVDGERTYSYEAYNGKANSATTNSASIEVLRGGLGYKYTTLRFQIPTPAYQLSAADGVDKKAGHEGGDNSERRNAVRARYQFVIYGISI